MTTKGTTDVRAMLRAMDDQLAALIAAADEQEDFLLGALLSDAHEHVLHRYMALPPA